MQTIKYFDAFMYLWCILDFFYYFKWRIETQNRSREWDKKVGNLGKRQFSIHRIWTLLLLLLSRFSCVRLCNSVDGSPQTEAHQATVPGILQARTLEWVAISLSNAWKRKVKVKSFSRVRLLATPWTAAYQAPPSMGFSRQEYWSGVCRTYQKLFYSMI